MRKFRAKESPTPCEECHWLWDWDNWIDCIARKKKDDPEIDIPTDFKGYSERKCKDFKSKGER